MSCSVMLQSCANIAELRQSWLNRGGKNDDAAALRRQTGLGNRTTLADSCGEASAKSCSSCHKILCLFFSLFNNWRPSSSHTKSEKTVDQLPEESQSGENRCCVDQTSVI